MKNNLNTFIWLFILLINFTLGTQAWAEATGPCRKIEKRSVCMPAPGPPDGPPGECGCTYCNDQGEAQDYNYASISCEEYEPPICTSEGCTQGPCKRNSCETKIAQCWSIDGGTLVTACPLGTDGEPDPGKCAQNVPAGFHVCSSAADESVHDLFCGSVTDGPCP